MRTYVQQLLSEGRAEGEMITRVDMIENVLREEAPWSMIERATDLDEAQFAALKRQVVYMSL
ncbi:hypothetical protein C2W62_21440 [Candidatus Entotheonella serta]|nr:hypothetical protein C2W62_21440 [Candidatus Entotheonella serta]